MDSLRMGLIGCGGMSGSHVEGLRQLNRAGLGNVEVVATCDLMEGAAARRASELAAFQKTNPKVYTEVAKMLESEEIDAVDICTEHRSHHLVALPCLQAGKHVIIEKPLGITMRACKLMNEAAADEGVVLAVAENYRRSSENRAIHWAASEGKIGEPRAIMWQQLGYSLGTWGWRHDKMKAGGGWILDGGVHYADLFIYNMGPVDKVSALTKTNEPVRYGSWPERKNPEPYTVEDLSLALLSFRNGTSGVWTWSNSTPGEELEFRVIYGSEGSVGWNKGLTSYMNDPPGQRTTSLQDLVRWMIREMDEEERNRLFPGGIGLSRDFGSTVAIEIWDFFEAIRDGRKPEVDGVLGAEAEAIPMSIFESSATGETVRLKDVLECRVEAYQGEINRDLGL
jgi:predicted dehydrogenase